MKKMLSLLLVVILCLSLAACGGDKGGSKTVYKLGDTVSTDIFEFKLNSAEFTVALNNVNNDKRYTAKEYDPKDDTDNPYVAPVGHTYVAFSYTIKNINRASSELHKGSFATVKYDGKSYSAMKDGAYFLYEDKAVMNSSGSIKTEKGGQWYNNDSSNCLLMTGAKQTRRARVDVSADVKDLTSDVEITFSIPTSDGKNAEFTYVVTEADRQAYKGSEIDMDLNLALVSFTKESGRAYFAEHLDEYATVSGTDMKKVIFRKWTVDYVKEGAGYWSGNFWFEKNGKIRDTYGYVNDRTWKIKGDSIIIDGEYICEMRKVADNIYLLVCEGKPYLLMR